MDERADQAASLRNRTRPAAGLSALQSRRGVCCLSVASGKGGVGKTFLAVNLAVAFGKMGKKVLLVDADLGLANADITLGVHPKASIQDALFKGRPLKEIVTDTGYGVDLMSASSGSKEMINMGAARMSSFIKELVSFAGEYDALIFDCSAGVDSAVTSFIAAAPLNLIIATPDPTSIMDVYALAKIIHQDNMSENLGLIVNMAKSEEEGLKVAGTLSRAMERHLSKSLELFGVIPESPNVKQALRQRKPLLAEFEDDEASAKIKSIALSILRKQGGTTRIEDIDAEKLAGGLLNAGHGV